MAITQKQRATVKPDVIQMLNGKAKVGSRFAITNWPALKFTARKDSLLIIEDGQTEPRPAKDHKTALAIATKYADGMRAKAGAK